MRQAGSVLIALILAACTLQYVPKPSSEELIVIPVFKPGQPVALVDKTGQRETRLPMQPYELQVDYRKYADSVMQLLQAELTKRGGVVEATSSRELRFELADVRMDRGVGRYRCVINFTIGTGDGYFRGLQASGVGWGYDTAINQAIVDVVKEILSDDKVRSYLSA
jgi:hypothetical protein